MFEQSVTEFAEPMYSGTMRVKRGYDTISEITLTCASERIITDIVSHLPLRDVNFNTEIELYKVVEEKDGE